MKYIFLLYLLILPYSYIVNVDTRQAQELFYQVFAVLILAAGLFFESKPLKKSRMNIALAVLFLWFLMIYLVSLTGWSILLNFFFGIGIYLTFIRHINKEDYLFLTRAVFVIIALTLLQRGLQTYGFDIKGQILFRAEGVPDCAFWGYKAPMGMYWAIALVLMLPFSRVMTGLEMRYRQKKGFKHLLRVYLRNSVDVICIYVLIGVYFIPIGMSYSSGAFLAGIVGVLFLFWFRKRILFWLTIIPIIAGGLIFMIGVDSPTGMMTSRVPMWGMVIQDIHKKPIVGYGLDGFRNPVTRFETAKAITRYYKNSFNDRTHRVNKVIVMRNIEVIDWKMEGKMTKEELQQFKKKIADKKNPLDFWDHPHNEFLWLGHSTGITGLIFGAGFLYFMFIRFKRSKRSLYATASLGALLVILVSSTTQFPFHLARIGHIAPVLLGLFYINTED